MTIRQDNQPTLLAGRLTAAMLLWFVLPPLLLIAISLLGLLVSYAVFHAVAELASIVIALAALLVSSIAHRFRKNDLLVYLGIVIGWCAVIDLWHTLTYQGVRLFPGDSANPPTQLWIAARYLQALGMITAPLFLHRHARVWLTHTGYGLATAGLLALIAYGVFPDAYIDGQGLTPFKIYSEYVIVLMLGAALCLLWRSRASMPRQMLLGIAIATVAMMLSELAFTQYVSVQASANMIGHLFKIIAYWFIFIGLVEWTLREPFELLGQSEARYRRTVDGANDGIWEWLPATGENYLSPRFKQLLGFADDELPNVPESFFDRIHAEDAEKVRKAFHAHLEERKPYAVDVRLKCKDGDYRWFYSRGQAEWDAEGKPLRMSGSITDIGELKKAQLELKENALALRERAKEVQCLNDVLSLGYRDSLPLPSLLQSAVRMLPQGWYFNDIVCARIIWENTTFTTDNFRETPWRLSAEISVAGLPAGLVEVFYLEERPARDVGPFLSQEVALIRSIATGLGVQIGRMKADEQLRKSQSRLLAIFEGAPVGISVMRASDGVLLDVNPAGLRNLGYTKADVVGRTTLELGIITNGAQRAEVLRMLREHGGVDDVQAEWRTKSGELRMMSYSGRLVSDEAGQFVLGMWQDVTDRVKAEERLRSSEARFRKMFSDHSAVLLLIEPESGAIVDANQAAANFYGYPVDRLKAMRIDEINMLGAEKSRAERDKAVAEERNYFIFPHRLASGEVRTVEVRSSPIALQEHALLFSIVSDITERRRTEEALAEQTRDLVARNEELTRFSQVAVDRELRMVELKHEVNALCARVGEPPRYSAGDDARQG